MENDAVTKISSQLRTRLEHLPADEAVRFVLVLDTSNAVKVTAPRSDKDRKANITAVRRAATVALEQVDQVLESSGGTRLTRTVDALGTVTVQATAVGVQLLADLPEVQAILEDQPIIGLATSRRGKAVFRPSVR
jgi:hypothetical protein